MTTPLIEAIARALVQVHADHVEAHNAVLAKKGFWPDPYASPTTDALAQAALTAITEAGYAVVPVEPTEAMCAEASEPAQAAALYRAMISAAQGDG